MQPKLILYFVVLAMLAITVGGCNLIYRNVPFVKIPRQTIIGPVEIGSEWLEIVPPQPIKVWGNENFIKVQYLKFKQWTAEDLNSYSKDGTILYLDDGRQTKVEAVIYDDKGDSHELRISGDGAVGGGFHLTPKWTTEMVEGKLQELAHSFPSDRTYTKLRIRSEISLKCDNIEWLSYNSY